MDGMKGANASRGAARLGRRWAAVALLAAAAGSAHAGDLVWSVGIHQPGVSVHVGNARPVVVAPPVVVMPPAVVTWPAPAVVTAPPVWVGTAPVVVIDKPRHRHHHHHGHWPAGQPHVWGAPPGWGYAPGAAWPPGRGWHGHR